MMQPPTLVWGAANWLSVVSVVAVMFVALLTWGYWRARASTGVRLLAATLKALGVAILALCLLEPLFSGTRARPGANQFVILADNSQSMTLRDLDAPQTRADQLKTIAAEPSKWIARLGEDFDLRQYAYDTQLRSVPQIAQLPFDGGGSALGNSLERLLGRYHARPLAGILLFTDGNATDAEAVERVLAKAAAADPTAAGKIPPIYPVILGEEDAAHDVNLQDIHVTQTNFEDAPVTLTADISASGFRGRTVMVRVLDDTGVELQKQSLKVEEDDKPMTVRFQLRPLQPGVSFYRVVVSANQYVPPPDKPDQPAPPDFRQEATLANNSRLVAVDRGQGPYRVLYVTGRPNWEFKFLQRALLEDTQVQLMAMIRIAKREPKFNYLGHRGESTNPLFRGFNTANEQDVQQYDQPVIVRFGAIDGDELRGGFPKAPEELYRYHAIILDDVESEFFTQDQMLLIKEFVRQRGGGLLMLGGAESFKAGEYDRTPIGDLLPVYVDQIAALPPDAQVRMALTREGWLEPWVRLRPEESLERQRLAGMPAFNVINMVRGIKPGATVLAQAELEDATSIPALVEQRFGHGRSAALLIGDLWRWDLKRPENTPSDMEKAWRQVLRWMVAEVPQRVEVAAEKADSADDPDGTQRLTIRVRDAAYKPLDNASVMVKVTGPDGKPVELTAEPNDREAGLYQAVYVPRQPGAYRAAVVASAPDSSDAGQAATGWSSDPAAEEFADLKPNRALLDHIAHATGGQTVAAGDLESFVAGLPEKHAEITEPYIKPMWHNPWVFLLAIACLSAEWGLRRWKGLP